MRIVSIISISLCALVSNDAWGKSIEDKKWILMESEHFVIHSVLTTRKTKDMLRRLEAMRSLFRPPGAMDKPDAKPTVIVAMGIRKDYVQLGLEKGYAGVFMSNLRQNTIVLNNNSRLSKSTTLLHEYVHFLLRQKNRLPYPKWYDEGYAEYVAASRISKSFFDIGMIDAGRANTLHHYRWLPWETILRSSGYRDLGSRDRSRFYAQSWLLVHFLHNQGNGQEFAHAGLARYVIARRNGAGEIEAFEIGFQMSIEDLDRSITRYFMTTRSNYTRFPTELLLPSFTTTTRRLSRAEVLIMLAQTAMLTGAIDQAQKWYTKALEDDSTKALALAGLGKIFQGREAYDDGQAHFERALELEPDATTILIDYAQYWSERRRTASDRELAMDYASKSVALLQKSRALGAVTPETDALLAFMYLRQGRDIQDAIALLESATTKSPTDHWPLLLLAQSYRAVGRYDEAIQCANDIIRYEHNENSNTRAAQSIIDGIENLNK